MAISAISMVAAIRPTAIAELSRGGSRAASLAQSSSRAATTARTASSRSQACGAIARSRSAKRIKSSAASRQVVRIATRCDGISSSS